MAERKVFTVDLKENSQRHLKEYRAGRESRRLIMASRLNGAMIEGDGKSRRGQRGKKKRERAEENREREHNTPRVQRGQARGWVIGRVLQE